MIAANRLRWGTIRFVGLVKQLGSILLFLGLIFFGAAAFAQDSPDISQGLSGMTTYHGSDFDLVDTVTGRLNLHIPLIVDQSQRGKLNFTYSLNFSGQSWYINNGFRWTNGGGQNRGVTLGIDGHLTALVSAGRCTVQTCGWAAVAYNSQADDGSVHPVGTISVSPSVMESIDGSGIRYFVNSANVGVLVDADGIQTSEPSYNPTTGAWTKLIEDPNGNEITFSGNSTTIPPAPTVMTDTLGRPWTQTFSSTNVTGCPTGGPVAPTSSTIWTVPGPANVNNGVRQFKFCYSPIPIQTNFPSGPSCWAYGSNWTLMTGVVLPDGTTWRFDYNNYGDPVEIVLPTGGTITYQWSTVSSFDACPIGDVGYESVSERTVFDGTNSYTWKYSFGPVASGAFYPSYFKVTDPPGNDTLYFPAPATGVPDPRGVATPSPSMGVGTIEYFAGSFNNGILLKTVTKSYQAIPNPYAGDVGGPDVDPIILTGVTNSYPNGQTTQTTQIQQSYDTGFTFTDTNTACCNKGNWTGIYGLVATKTAYDYGNGAPGSVLSFTNTNYLALSNSGYLNANLLNLASSVIALTASSGNKCSETDYGYDVAAQIIPSGVTEQHVAAPSAGVLGNLTSVTRQLSSTPCQSGGSWSSLPPTLNYVYDTGMLQKTVDPLTNPTTYSYSGTYYGAFPTTVTNALGQQTTYTYDFNTGLVTAIQDPNDLANGRAGTTSPSYDSMLRPLQANFPDGGQTTIAYNYSGNVFVGDTVTKLATPDPSIVTAQVFDGLGRLKETQLTSDPAGTDYTDVTYDADGRQYKVYNPTRCNPAQTNCGSESTWGYITYNYDPLNRVTSVVEQDGSTVGTNYSSFPCTTVTDEAGKARSSCVDGAGRMTSVVEDPGSSPHFNYQTSYGYDALNNLLSVTQNSSRQRGFTYDSLSRLLTANNPESGTINYYYTTSGGALCAGDISALCRRTDARTTTTTYAYEALNRLTSKTYSDSTPGAYFTYDQTSPWGFTLTNPIGRLTTTGTTTGPSWLTESAFSYDAMGRLILEVPCIGTNCVSAYFTYDLAGAMNAILYPSTRYVTSKYNGAMQPSQVTFASFNNTPINYNYLSSASYAPTGAPTIFTLGSGVIETDCYNNRLQPGNMQIASGAFTWLNRTYNFYPTGSGGCPPQTGSNNGNVMGIADNLQPNRTQTFGYDSLNRISTAQSAATSGADCWGQSFGYDAWANLLSESATKCSGGQPSVSVNTQNRITNTGVSYDAAGDMRTDGANPNHTYTYDAENRITTLNGTAATYTYDAQGQRVNKQTGSNTTGYVYFNGQPIAESASGVWTDYIFAGSRRLASSIGTNENSITNGSFEQGLTNWGTWGTATMVNNTANAHSGSNYAQISATTGGYSGVNNQTIAVQPGDQITFGGWVNLQSGSSTSPGWVLAVYNSSLTPIANIVSPTPPSSQWMYQSVNYAVPTGGAYVMLYAQVNQPSGSTVIWVDDGFISTGTAYYHGDHLGSARVMSDTGGNVIWSATYLPFGQEWNPQPTVNHYKFTGKERDSESGLDDFGARYYSSQYGRFVSPDFLEPDDTDPLPYADLEDPQTINLYAYSRNNPLSYIDKNGHGLECTSSTTSDERGIHQVLTCHEVPDSLLPRLYDSNISRGGIRFLDTKMSNDLQMGRVKMVVAEIPIDEAGAKALAELATGLKPLAESPELQKIIDRLWQTTDKLPGGTAGAVRHELATGELLSKTGHSIKAGERINQLGKLINSGALSVKDSALAKAIVQDLKSALGK